MGSHPHQLNLPTTILRKLRILSWPSSPLPSLYKLLPWSIRRHTRQPAAAHQGIAIRFCWGRLGSTGSRFMRSSATVSKERSGFLGVVQVCWIWHCWICKWRPQLQLRRNFWSRGVSFMSMRRWTYMELAKNTHNFNYRPTSVYSV